MEDLYLNKDLEKMLEKIIELESKYEDREKESISLHKEFDWGYHRGKKEAYRYISRDLKNLLHWHSIIDLSKDK